MTSALLNNGYGNWVAVRKEAKLTSWPLSDVAKACRVVVLQLLHVACLGTHEHSGWAKASGADGTGAGTLDIGTGGAGADADGILAASSSSSSSWLCSHEDLGYLDACLRKHAHSHKVCRLALAAALEEASGAPSHIPSQIPEDASGALIPTPSQIPSQIPEDALCAAAAVHAADHCHAILTLTQGPASQTQCGLFPLPFVCHTSSGTKTAATTTTVMTAETEAATAEMAAESSTTTEAVATSDAAAAMMTVDRLSIEHILQMSAAASAAATAPATAADIVTSTATATTIAVTTTTDQPSDPCNDPLSAYCSLVRQVMVKGQNPLPLHPLFSSSGSGNGASAGAGAGSSGAVGAASSSSSSSSSSTAVAVDRSNLLKQRTSARARYHTPS